jgi:hypothetical protein
VFCVTCSLPLLFYFFVAFISFYRLLLVTYSVVIE